MGTFGDRLRFAIHNYAIAPISYKDFSNISKIPYRTLQNYLSNKRSPNYEALQKFYKLGICVNWLLSGDGKPYLSHSLNTVVEAKIYLSCCKIIAETCLSNNSDILSSKDKNLLLNFMFDNHFINIDQAVEFLIVDEYGEQYFDKFEDIDQVIEVHELPIIFDGEIPMILLDEFSHFSTSFDDPPNNKSDMQVAIKNLMCSRKAGQFPPPTIEDDEQGPQ